MAKIEKRWIELPLTKLSIFRNGRSAMLCKDAAFTPGIVI
ncbi:hypothetical protein DAT1711_16700 [Enterococcus cecorum]